MNDGPTTYQTVVFTIWAIFQVLGVLLTISMIGKARKPIEAGHALTTMVFSAVWIALFWTAFIL